MKNLKEKNVRFIVDFLNKQIVGTKASFDKASKGSGPIYEELARKVASHPDFAFETILPKNPPKEKETYKGMDIAWIRSYIEMVDDKKFAEKIEKVKGMKVYIGTRAKTSQTFTIPLLKPALAILKKYNNHLPIISNYY